MNTHLRNLDLVINSIDVVENGREQWFSLSDVVAVLYLAHENETLSGLTVGLLRGDRLNDVYDETDMFISEGDFYKIVMRSDAPVAQDFQNWVNHVVLPEINEDGGYFTFSESRPQRSEAVKECIYKSAMRSDDPEVQAYQAWATEIVLPAIRKDGGYIMGEEQVADGKMAPDELMEKSKTVAKAKFARKRTQTLPSEPTTERSRSSKALPGSH